MPETPTRRLLAVVLIGVVVGLPLAGTASGQGAPSSYYGPAVAEDGTALPDGTTIIAVADGTVEDQITVSGGTYGGDDPLDEKLRVSNTNATVHFYVETDDGTRIEANRTDPDPSPGTKRFALAFPNGTASPGSNFQITALEPGDVTVFEDETVTITAEITNRVESGTETVSLRIDGTERASRSVTLGTDEREQVTFAVDASSLAAGDHTYTVATENDERASALTVRATSPTFTVSGLTPSDATVDRATRFEVSATITNGGTESGTQTVAYTVDGTRIETTTVALDPNESTTVSFAGLNSSQFGSGRHSHAVTTANGSQSGTLTIEGPAPPTFAIIRLDPESVTVAAETTVEIAATVSNTGTQTGTQRVRFRLDGDQYFGRPVSLDGGARTTVAFTVETSSLDRGSHTYTFVTENDTGSGTLTVGSTTTATTATAEKGETETATATRPSESSTPVVTAATRGSATATETETVTETATATPLSSTTAATSTAPTTTTGPNGSETASAATTTDAGGDGGLLSMGLLQMAALSLGALLVVVYTILKALAIYLGY